MRKLGILVLAMIVVFSFSIVGFAEFQDDLDVTYDVGDTDNTAFWGGVESGPQNISVEVNIGKAANVAISNESISLALTEVNTTPRSNKLPVIITTNTPVKISFEENISRNMLEYLRQNTELNSSSNIWRWDSPTGSGYEGYGNGDNWFVSPNVVVTPSSWKDGGGNITLYKHDNGFGKNVYLAGTSRQLYEVQVEAGWRSHNSNGEELPWYKLKAGDQLTGIVTVTVEAD